MDKIKQSGKQLLWICRLLLIISPLVYIGIIYGPGIETLLHLPDFIYLQLNNASLLKRLVIYSIPALTPALYWMALFYIYKLAQQYAGGHVFSHQSIKTMRQVGVCLLLTDFMYMFQIAITGPLLYGLELSESYLLIEIKLGVSIIGLFIILISRIMLVAVDLNEQQKLTI